MLHVDEIADIFKEYKMFHKHREVMEAAKKAYIIFSEIQRSNRAEIMELEAKGVLQRRPVGGATQDEQSQKVTIDDEDYQKYLKE